MSERYHGAGTVAHGVGVLKMRWWQPGEIAGIEQLPRMLDAAFGTGHSNSRNGWIQSQVRDHRIFIALDAHKMQVVGCADLEVSVFRRLR
jgi:hypothetical protein